MTDGRRTGRQIDSQTDGNLLFPLLGVMKHPENMKGATRWINLTTILPWSPFTPQNYS